MSIATSNPGARGALVRSGCIQHPHVVSMVDYVGWRLNKKAARPEGTARLTKTQVVQLRI
jgi:hypothetical protein